jgi:hypothetical protein
MQRNSCFIPFYTTECILVTPALITFILHYSIYAYENKFRIQKIQSTENYSCLSKLCLCSPCCRYSRQTQLHMFGK